MGCSSVSSSGFYKTAIKKANFYGIKCLRTEEVNGFDWLLTPSLRMFTFILLGSQWNFISEFDDIIDKENFEITNAQNNIINRNSFNNIAQQTLNRIRSKYSAPIFEKIENFKFDCKDLYLRDTKSGKRVRAQYVVASIKFSIKEDSIPFTCIEYTNDISETISEKIVEAAIANLDYEDFPGKLMITNKKDEGCKIIFLPDEK